MATMSKNRINYLVDTAIEVAQDETALTPNSIATAMNWNQSSLTRALQCRQLEFPAREGRASLQQLVYDAVVSDDDARLEELRALIKRLSAVKDVELPEAYQPVEEEPAEQPEVESGEDEDLDLD